MFTVDVKQQYNQPTNNQQTDYLPVSNNFAERERSKWFKVVICGKYKNLNKTIKI